MIDIFFSGLIIGMFIGFTLGRVIFDKINN